MGPRQIVVVESDPVLSERLGAVLQAYGFEILTLTDGEGLLLNQSLKPSLIVLCIDPKRLGWAVANRTKKSVQYLDVPLIITSAECSDRDFDEHKKLRTGAEGYLHKPYSTERLLNVIDQLIGLQPDTDGTNELRPEDLEEIPAAEVRPHPGQPDRRNEEPDHELASAIDEAFKELTALDKSTMILNREQLSPKVTPVEPSTLPLTIQPERRSIFKNAETEVFICGTDAPWLLPADALVLPAGSRGNPGGLFNALIQYTKMRELPDRLQERLKVDSSASSGLLRPENPILLNVPVDMERQYKIPPYLIVATCFDRNEIPDAKAAAEATSAVLRLASRHHFSRITLPLLGGGAGGLFLEEVAFEMLTAIRSGISLPSIKEVTLTHLGAESVERLSTVAKPILGVDSPATTSKPSTPIAAKDPPSLSAPIVSGANPAASPTPTTEPKPQPTRPRSAPSAESGATMSDSKSVTDGAKPASGTKSAASAKGGATSPQATPTHADLWLRIQGNRRELRLGKTTLWQSESPPFDWKAPLFGLDKELTLSRAKDRLPSWGGEEVRRFGDQLAALLWGNPTPEKIVESLAVPVSESRRLILDLDENAASVPWEYLRLEDSFLLESRLSIVRHVSTKLKLDPAPIALSAPRALLLAISNVGDPYPVDKHKWSLTDALRGIELQTIDLPHCRAKDLAEHLSKDLYDGLHFLGHGEQGCLLVHADDKPQDRVTGTDLANWLGRSSRIGFVFMGACHSGAVPMRDEDFSGVAWTLTRNLGVPVVAMQMAVPQEFSTEFAACFYRELRKSGYNLEQAVYEARKFEHGQRCAFGIPVLFADFAKVPRVSALSEPPQPKFQPVIELVLATEWKNFRAPPGLEDTLSEALNNIPPQVRVPTPHGTSPEEALRSLLRWISPDKKQLEQEEARVAKAYAPPSEPAAGGDLPVGEPVVRLDRDFDFSDWTALSQSAFTSLHERYSFNKNLIPTVIAELAAGRHILFTGPVGTGKTSFARELIAALGYKAHIVTASADWTNHEVVGGHFPQSAGSGGIEFVFRPGAFVEAVLANWRVEPTADGQVLWTRNANTWLLIDEFNRADMDRALGGLLTALETRSLRIPAGRYTPGGTASVEIPIPRDFRVLCTLNTVDRHYLFRLSDALKRRFSFVEIPMAENWNDEWQRLTELRGNADAALCQDVRRAVYLVRLLHELGTAHLRAALLFLRASQGSPLTNSMRLTQAIAGSILPALEDADPNVLELLAAWASGAQIFQDVYEKLQASSDEIRSARLRRGVELLRQADLAAPSASSAATELALLTRQAVVEELPLRSLIARMIANVR